MDGERIIKLAGQAHLARLLKMSATDLIKTTGRLTVGIGLPLDNDRFPGGEAVRIIDGRLRGVSDLASEAIPTLDETKAARPRDNPRR